MSYAVTPVSQTDGGYIYIYMSLGNVLARGGDIGGFICLVLLARQVIVIVGDSGLCCRVPFFFLLLFCIRVTSIEHYYIIIFSFVVGLSG